MIRKGIGSERNIIMIGQIEVISPKQCMMRIGKKSTKIIISALTLETNLVSPPDMQIPCSNL